MRILVLLAALIIGGTAGAVELQAGLLPSFIFRDGAVGLLRADVTLLFGGDFLLVGPYAMYEGISPQVTDTALGAALRIGHDTYFEARAGQFQRVFSQPGTGTLNGRGFMGNLVFGMHLSPHFGVDAVLSGKRIQSGSLDKRWIIDLLPLLTLRADLW